MSQRYAHRDRTRTKFLDVVLRQIDDWPGHSVCFMSENTSGFLTPFFTSFVLADTEKLHEKILLMSDRIRQLEDAVTVLQLSVAPREPHPLLRRDLLEVKSIIDLHVAVDEDKIRKITEPADDESQYIEAFGTLALRDDGAATFYGRSAGSEVSDICAFFLLHWLLKRRYQEPADCKLTSVSSALALN